MVEHLVLFKLHNDATPAQVEAMLQALRALPTQIDTIRELSCGHNFCDRSNGHQVGLRVLFDDRAGLEVYAPHPAHTGCVATCIKPILEQVTVVDYEC
ncbi:MAG: Dabb family protein [Fimbriimonadaceae bacterium]|nr:Dabb family protein [Fimbriimonadaceae bacterium]